MELSRLVKKRRQELGISQTKLAKLLSLESGQLISNIERGKCGFPRRRLKRLCRALLLDQSIVIQACLDDELSQLKKLVGAK